jgi:YHS domain-containing protein
MDIDIQNAAGRSDYNEKTYYFCSRGCKLDFDEDPEGVLKREAEHDHSQPVEHAMDMASAGAQTPKRPWWQFWKR